MAKKIKLMSLFQELSGRAAVTNRRPATTATGIYLMQLRSHDGITTLPRRRFMISVDLSKSPALPHPVKITMGLRLNRNNRSQRPPQDQSQWQ